MPNPIGFYKSIFGNQFGLLGPGATAANPLNTVEAAADGLTVVGKNLNISADGLTAHAGGGQASATQLTATFNTVTTVASVGDSVKLPVARPGALVLISNKGANLMQVFGFGTDTIDGIAGSVGVSQNLNATALFFCSVAGQWHSGPGSDGSGVAISQLPTATLTPTESDVYFPIVQALANYKATYQSLSSLLGAMQQVSISSQPSIDTTGVADSQAGFVLAQAVALALGRPLIVDCKVKIAIGIDDSKCIFLRAGTSILGTPAGELIVDNSYIPAFIFHHSTDVVIRDLNVRYVGGAPWDDTIAPYPTLRSHFNDVVMKGDMAANFGNTFSGSGSSLFSGHTNPQAVFYMIGGCARVSFNNVRIYAPQGANAANFVPVCITINNQWTPNTLVPNNNQPVTASVAVQPLDIDIINCRFDGFYMGIVGQGGARISGLKCYRYSDLQKADGTGVGGNANYFAPPHAVYLNDPDPSFTGWTREIINVFDYGVYVGGAVRRAAGASGSCLSFKISPCQNTTVDGYTSLRPDGFMDCLTNSYGNAFGSLKNLNFVYDSRTQTFDAASIWGVRFPSSAPYQYLTIDGLIGRDLNPAPTQFPIVNISNINNQNCDFKGVKMYLNDWPVSGNPGFSLSGNEMTLDADYYFNTYSSDANSVGSAVMTGSSLATNSDINIRVKGYRLFPVTFAAPPTGTSAALAANWTHSNGLYLLQFASNEVRYATLTNGQTTCTWAATGGGALVGFATTGASGDGTTATITYSTAGGVPPIGSQVLISGVTPAGYNGTFTVTASSPGSVSFANATTGNQTVAGIIANFVNATAQNSLGANYAGYKQRMTSMQSGQGIGNHIRIMDVTNGLESIHDNGVVSEYWSQTWSGTPPAGMSFALPISIPATHNPDRFSVYVQTTLGNSNGLTSFSLGWAATPAALLSGIGLASGTNTPVGINAPVTTNAGTNRTLLLTATGGTGFDGTGLILVTVRAASMDAAS